MSTSMVFVRGRLYEADSVVAVELIRLRTRKRRSRRECRLERAVKQVLLASEDGGLMTDIDWEQLRKALK